MLARSFASDRVAGTYLLCGPNGCGRWALAVSFAALLNCDEPVEGGDDPLVKLPCGECRNCRVIFGLNHEGLYFAVPMPPLKKPDDAILLTNEVLALKREEPFALLSSAANLTIPIDVGRRIKRDVASRAPEGTCRAIIFYQMERMRPEAADALLKLIEEPPPRAVILLIAEKAERLLSTIQSRSQKITLHSSASDVVADYLQENYEVSDERATLLARIAEGVTGRAVDMAEGDGAEDGDRREVGFALFDSLFTEKGPDTVAKIMNAVGDRNRGEAEHLLNLWQSLVRDCTHIAMTGDAEGVVNVDYLSKLQTLSTYFSDPNVAVNTTEDIKIALAHFRLNVHIHGALASLVLKVKEDLL